MNSLSLQNTKKTASSLCPSFSGKLYGLFSYLESPYVANSIYRRAGTGQQKRFSLHRGRKTFWEKPRPHLDILDNCSTLRHLLRDRERACVAAVGFAALHTNQANRGAVNPHTCGFAGNGPEGFGACGYCRNAASIFSRFGR